MTNELFLNQIKPRYESLQNFEIHNNTLYFNDDRTYMFPLNNVKLNLLNESLFNINPRSIYRIIYLYELLPKIEITDDDIVFIKQYVEKYIKTNDMRLNGEQVDEQELYQMSIPISMSYDPQFSETPASGEIRSAFDKHASESRGPRLVLTNQNFKGTNDDFYNTLDNLEKAGYTTLFLIGTAIILTCIYIAVFIASK